jgi:aspartyl aminopeptidase
VDLGMPQLSMHSVREMMGAQDLANGLSMFKGFLKDFRAIDDEIGS